MRRQNLFYPLLIGLLIASCSEENPGAVPDVELREGVDSTLLVELADIYLRQPILSACDPGLLDPAEEARVVAYINEVRALHRLSPVVWDESHLEEVRQAALIIVANNFLAHNPPRSLLCWSETGLAGSQTSNLSWASRYDGRVTKGFSSEYMVDSWWKDSGVSLVGHRRWMLDPFLQRVAFARVDKPETETESGVTGAALHVIEEERLPSQSLQTLDFVAYPFELYPAHLFNSGISLSFSAIVDNNDYWGNQSVNLEEATITMTEPSGRTLAVRNIRRKNDAFGLPNALIWDADVVSGVRYTVTIEGVSYAGEQRGYTYWFEVEIS